jgi:hypothetical protein
MAGSVESMQSDTSVSHFEPAWFPKMRIVKRRDSALNFPGIPSVWSVSSVVFQRFFGFMDNRINASAPLRVNRREKGPKYFG